MIGLSTTALVEAVRRSLIEEVQPTLTDEFARVQVEAALAALEEVADRLEQGDPVAEENSRLSQLLEQSSREVPAAGLAPLAGSDGSDAGADPREWNRAAREAIWVAVQAAEPETARRVLSEFSELESASAMADARWICDAALTSLT